MDPLKALLRAADAASRPDADEVARVRRRLDRAVRGDRHAAGLLRGVGAPDPAVADRLRDRLLVPRRPRSRAPLVLAAAAALAVAWWGWPAPPDDSLALELAADDPRTVEATRDVELRFTGRGMATGTRRAPRIRWQRGHLELDVAPARGVDLVVTTPEAEVAVVGTVFDVDRDGLGTTVRVTRGEVAVRCTSGASHRLTAGEVATCAPTDAAGLLGRARTLEGRGAPADEVLAALDHALAAGGPPLVRGELLASRTRVLLAAGRTDDAVDTARRYLDEGHAPRRDELRALVEAYSSPSERSP